MQEVAFPAGKVSDPSKNDLRFVKDVLNMVERERVPAPCPIEQRWSTRSKARMSPVYSEDPDALHSWVGVIMYLPLEDEERRKAITDRFFAYSGRMLEEICPKYNATEHWAKIEAPAGERALLAKQERLRSRFPIREFNEVRKEVDPKNILANELFDSLLPRD